eukprot:8594642-Ditylum_brightwellii.AAC.1
MGNHQQRALSEMDMKFQHPSGINQLTIYVNATHSTCVRSQRLISRHVAIMTGATVDYSTKWHQQTVSTSSTEA